MPPLLHVTKYYGSYFLVWDQTTLLRYRWLWFDVTNYMPYIQETSYEESLFIYGASSTLGSRGAALALSGLLHVARSLTSNARGVFRILIDYQLEENTGENESEEERTADEGIHVYLHAVAS